SLKETGAQRKHHRQFFLTINRCGVPQSRPAFRCFRLFSAESALLLNMLHLPPSPFQILRNHQPVAVFRLLLSAKEQQSHYFFSTPETIVRKSSNALRFS